VPTINIALVVGARGVGVAALTTTSLRRRGHGREQYLFAFSKDPPGMMNVEEDGA